MQNKLLQKIQETKDITNITQTIQVDYANNKTTITLNIEINANATLYNVSIFQEIPLQSSWE